MREMAPARSAPISVPSMRTIWSPGRSPACCAGEPSIGRRILTAVLGHHLDADAGVGAHGGQADLVELLAVEVGGVRIERGDHAAHRLLHERVVVDVVDVLALDALVDLGEQARLLPRQAGARGLRQRLAGTRRAAVGEHAAGEGTAESRESTPAARARSVRGRVVM